MPFAVHSTSDYVLIHHTCADPMAKKEYLSLSTVSYTPFPATSGWLEHYTWDSMSN